MSQQKGHNNDSKEMKTMLRHKHQSILRNHLLYRKIQFPSYDQPSLQFALTQNHRQQAIKACHDNIDHLGLERSLDLLKDRFYWAGMIAYMENHIQTCNRCLCFKSKPQKTELYPITAIHPLELIHMDFLTIESGKTGKDVNILVINDHLTWYAQAFVTPSLTAQVVAQTLWDKFFMHYGLPEKNLSNQGYNCNRRCECFNATLILMIDTLPTEAKINWQEQLSTLVHAYNCSHLNATGFSPFYLMFGRHPMLSIDIQFGVECQTVLLPHHMAISRNVKEE